jgi:ABC-2 type transport system permease protein
MLLILCRLFRHLRAGRSPSRAAAHWSVPAWWATKGGFVHLALHQARYDLRAFLRNKQARFSTLILPPLLLIAFATEFGSATVGSDHAERSTYYVPAVSALAVLVACFASLAVSITAQRESGVLKRRRVAPVPASALVAGRVLAALVASLAAVAAVGAIGRVAYGVDLPVAAVPALAVTALVGSVAFASLAYALSSAIRSTDAAQPIVQAITLPLYVVSGVFVPEVDLPSWLRELGMVFPLERLADGLHHAYDPGLRSLAWGDLGVLVVWAAAGLAIALRRFKWTPAAASA